MRPKSTLLLSLPLLLLLGCARAPAPQQPGAGNYYHPGFNLFSQQQDVAVGKQAAAQVEKQVPILHNARATHYLTSLGDQLAQHMPGPQFPYNFHIVNQKQINAFALPGGPIFVNVGAFCAAADEAQLAGVVAHEESHVALRHSTSMASKQQIAAIPLGLLGQALGGNQLAQVAAQFAVGSIFLKYSRDMESQADALGAQVMNVAGYDPRAMVQFFETLQAQGGSQAIQFLSDHPNPGNRRAAVEAEIPDLGPHPPYHNDSPAFEQTKADLCGKH